MITCEGVPVVIDERIPYGTIQYTHRSVRRFWEMPIGVVTYPVLVAATATYDAALAYNLAEAYAPWCVS